MPSHYIATSNTERSKMADNKENAFDEISDQELETSIVDSLVDRYDDKESSSYLASSKNF